MGEESRRGSRCELGREREEGEWSGGCGEGEEEAKRRGVKNE